MRVLLLIPFLTGCATDATNTEQEMNLTWCFGYCGKLEAQTKQRQINDSDNTELVNKIREREKQ
jgi:hypothetical protein